MGRSGVFWICSRISAFLRSSAMNRVPLFAIFLLVCTAWLPAQTVERQSPNTLVLKASCPVSMHALQGSGGGLVAVRGEKQVSGPSQRIHLVLANDKERRITRAT